jgi:NitT/TauT family transport system substrate-binding protein
MNSKRTLFVPVILVLVALLATACGGTAEEPSSGAEAPASPPAETSIQLSWIHEYSVSGFHAAEENGHFAAENLEVRMEEGGFGEEGYIDPIAQVLDGSEDFGLADGFQLLTARAEGKPVVAIGVIFQRSPIGLVSLAESNMARPQDLVGHTVSVAEGGGAQLLYGALLSSQGVDPAEVNFVPRTTFGIDPLINGEVDTMGAWIVNEGVAVEEAGYEPQFILYSDYGVEAYQVAIFTTEEMIAEKPDVVERFLRATAQGWQDVIDDPDGAAELTLQYNDGLDLEAQRRRLQASLPLINPAGSRPVMMQPDVWESTHNIMLEQGLLDEPLDIDEVYTLEFLDRIYAE